MNLQDEVIRSIVRGAGYRLFRGAPVWVAIVVLVATYVFGGVR